MVPEADKVFPHLVRPKSVLVNDLELDGEVLQEVGVDIEDERLVEDGRPRGVFRRSLLLLQPLADVENGDLDVRLWKMKLVRG